MSYELNENELVLLDNLVYLRTDNNYSNSNGQHTVSDIINNFMNNSKKIEDTKNRKGEYPAQMSKAEWQNILVNISKNDRLMNLRIDRIVENSDGMKAMVLVENPKDKTSATVIFRGTTCDKEWLDNGQGGYLSDTEGQKQSLQLINSLT